MNLQAIINSQYGVGLALGLGRALPQGMGHSLASRAGGWIAGMGALRMVQAVRANQWVVSGGSLSPAALTSVTRSTFQYIGRSLYDLYHNIDNPQAILEMVCFSPEFERAMRRIQQGRSGTFFVCLHLSNFDLIGRALGLHGLKIQVLSVPQPSGGYRWQNQLREEVGLDVTPISIAALRKASERLAQGGIVLTGIDRPAPDSKYKVQFFGHPAALPVAHVRMALKVGVPVTLVAGQTQPDGSYLLLASDPIPMEPCPDLMEETVSNAERILSIAETWIRRTPDQWAMSYPVWPEVVEELRGKS
ncbi:MAG: lysophospholipid acyltransferase family protein [Anaerolineaceae bacterium]|nr:lysophospholipid acyltransferase family protein [Anaerolineaceae bacterium]